MMRFLPLIVMALALALFAVLLAQPKVPAIGRTGQTVPNVDLLARDGLREPLLNGRVQVINVFASWCVPCAAEMSKLKELQQGGIDVVGLVYKDKWDAVNNFLKKYGNPYQALLMDDGGKAAIALGLTGVPETFVIDGSGTVIWHTPGALSDDQVAEIRQSVRR